MFSFPANTTISSFIPRYCDVQEVLQHNNPFIKMSQVPQKEEEVKKEDATTYNFEVSQNHSLAQQITLLELSVQNDKTKATYSNKFTGTAVKKQGFPSNDLTRVENYVKKAYAGETSGLTLLIDEKPSKKGEGVVDITVTKDDPDFGAMIITFKLKELKRSETDVLRCVTVRYMSTFHSSALSHSSFCPFDLLWSLCEVSLALIPDGDVPFFLNTRHAPPFLCLFWNVPLIASPLFLLELQGPLPPPTRVLHGVLLMWF